MALLRLFVACQLNGILRPFEYCSDSQLAKSACCFFSSVIMELVGYDSAAMSAHYTSIGKESLAKAQEVMPVL